MPELDWHSDKCGESLINEQIDRWVVMIHGAGGSIEVWCRQVHNSTSSGQGNSQEFRRECVTGDSSRCRTCVQC